MPANIVFQDHAVTPEVRAKLLNQNSITVWFTGLSGAGKSTLANALEIALCQRGIHTYLLDGDNVRLGLCKDLGFSDVDRVENIRRVSEVANLLADAGLVVITAFISPFNRDRALAREVIGTHRFVEVFVDTPLAICEERDPKGLYGKARAGLIQNFTGIDSLYEAPLSPDIRVNAHEHSVNQCVQEILNHLGPRIAR